jgi:hypothetical protein
MIGRPIHAVNHCRSVVFVPGTPQLLPYKLMYLRVSHLFVGLRALKRQKVKAELMIRAARAAFICWYCILHVRVFIGNAGATRARATSSRCRWTRRMHAADRRAARARASGTALSRC